MLTTKCPTHPGSEVTSYLEPTQKAWRTHQQEEAKVSSRGRSWPLGSFASLWPELKRPLSAWVLIQHFLRDELPVSKEGSSEWLSAQGLLPYQRPLSRASLLLLVCHSGGRRIMETYWEHREVETPSLLSLRLLF